MGQGKTEKLIPTVIKCLLENKKIQYMAQGKIFEIGYT